MNSTVNELADEIVTTLFRQSPLSAFLMGLDDVGGSLDDLSLEERDALVSRYTSIAERAAVALDNEASLLSRQDVLTLDHIRRSAAAYAERLVIPQVEFTVTNFSTAPLAALISVLPQLPVGTPARRQRYLECLHAIPRFLAQATERHRAGISQGLVPTSRGVHYAIDQLDAFVRSPDHSGMRRGADNDAEFAAAQEITFDTEILPAVAAYREVLTSELAPHGRSDEMCGLHWLPGGDEMYQQRVRQYTWSPTSAQEVHDLGLSLIARLKEEFVEVGSRLWGEISFDDLRAKLVDDPSLRFDTSEEILNAAVAAVRHAEAVAPQFFGVVPNEPCAVSPIPDALADSAAVAYYYGGAVDGSRPETYFVNTSKPTQRNRHTAEAVAYHEAVPGHHFQLTIAQEFEDTWVPSDARRDELRGLGTLHGEARRRDGSLQR